MLQARHAICLCWCRTRRQPVHSRSVRGGCGGSGGGLRRVGDDDEKKGGRRMERRKTAVVQWKKERQKKIVSKRPAETSKCEKPVRSRAKERPNVR